MQENIAPEAFGSACEGVSKAMWVFGRREAADVPELWTAMPSGLSGGDGLCASQAGILPLHGAAESGLVLEFQAKQAFDWLVPWWNADTAGSGRLDLQVQVRTQSGWSRWYDMETWGASSSSHSGGDELAKVDTDILKLTVPADGFRLNIRLSGACVLHRCGVIARDSKTLRPPTDLSKLTVKDNPAPRRSQKVEDPSIKGRICSPTSVSMALESLGINLPTHFVAADCHDEGDKMYGNWPFNVASLWRLGARARLDFFPNTGMAAGEILKGRLLIASVRFAEGVLDGAPMKSTNGHLILVRGLVKDESGEWRVLVNDPAAATPEETPRRYLVSQFDKAWTGVAYVVEGSRR
jgi:hypothetical protein